MYSSPAGYSLSALAVIFVYFGTRLILVPQLVHNQYHIKSRTPVWPGGSQTSFSQAMDLQNLQTASHYLNNLLLARGLLRDAIPLDFANPGAAKGGLETTMAQIIRLVHDLVLRRDVSVAISFELFMSTEC